MKKKLISLFLALALMASVMTGALAATDEAYKAARELNELGLFNGVGQDIQGNPIFELDRQPTRAEAVTMLVRLLGKETEASSKSWNTPFTDVEEWARPYVGYAYENGLTKGTSATTFGSGESVSAAQYLTFVLRALGYDDTNGDFVWSQAWVLSDKLGITSGQYGAQSAFTRGDVAIVSNKALSCNIKSGDKKLLDTLTVGGVPLTVLSQLGEYLQIGGEADKRGIEAAKGAYQVLLAGGSREYAFAYAAQAKSCFAEASMAYTMASKTCAQYDELKTLGQMFGFLATIDNGNATAAIDTNNYVEYVNQVIKSYDSLMEYYTKTADELARIHKK